MAELRPLLDQCWQRDRYGFWKRWRELSEQPNPLSADDPSVQSLRDDLAASRERVQQRLAQRPALDFDEMLPVCAQRERIAQAIREHQVVVIAGETGSGKTTQIPKICLELGRGARGLIGHTQPRRLAARSVAARIADELKTPLGGAVGYQVRFNEVVGEDSYIKLMTDGILLAEIQNDRFLNRYDTLIIDEAHERSLNIDFLLGYLKQLLPRRPDLKVIITSATIDVETFSKHFNNAPVITIEGRTYPVEVRYRPIEDLVAEPDLSAAIDAAIGELASERGGLQGDVLVFLPGEREIREAALQLRKSQELRKSAVPHLEVIPLYARLSLSEQQRVFDISKRRGTRIVLTTNVAETSLTVPGIRYVIDSGFARISRYSVRSKLQRLPIEPVSKASAEQRKGRCGRIGPGICVRLYSELDFLQRPEFTDAEILRTNLASVILQLLALRFGSIDEFPFVDAPDSRQIGDGFSLLEELGAVHGRKALTRSGAQLARLPVDPRIARMLLAAQQLGSLREISIIAAALSIQDPRERPADKQQAADEMHRRFHDPESDFIAYIKLWDYLEEQRQALSQNQLRKLCEREFLNYLRVREWRDVHHQLKLACGELGWRENQLSSSGEGANYEAIHRAILAGLLSHIAMLDEKREYLGARNRKLRIFPGSGLFKKSPKWIVAAEVVETTQVYARTVASIDPSWVLGINDTLLKRSHSEPHWHAKSGRVLALETVVLYGLVVSDKQRVHFGAIDPAQAREIFIRNALVAGDYRTQAAFFLHNQKLIADIEGMEEKARRRDILADEEELFRFYDERIPADIVTAAQFEQWRKRAEAREPRVLFVPRERLMLHAAESVTQAQFPDYIEFGDMRLQLQYRFEPGKAHDGVNVIVPIALLNRVPDYYFEWLVPGLLREKCIALLKTLPKQLRKQFVPIPEAVDRVLPQLRACDRPLTQVLSDVLAQGCEKIPPTAWQLDELDAFYRANFRVVEGRAGDSNGRLLGEGRDLADLKQRLRAPMQQSLQREVDHGFQRTALQAWNFGELPKAYRFDQAGVTVTAYPALVDERDSVAIQLLESPAAAQQQSERGVIRLLQLQTAPTLKYLRKELLRGNMLNLQFAGIEQKREQWIEEILEAAYRELFIEGRELPRSEIEFNERLAQGKGEIIAVAQRYEKLLISVAGLYARIRQSLRANDQVAWKEAFADIGEQLAQLFRPRFIAETSWQWLQHYPRYLQAIAQRIDKLRGFHARDRDLSRELAPLQRQLLDLLQSYPQRYDESSTLRRYRWLLEELRVSLFAQGLRTLEPVSVKRLRDLWRQIESELSAKGSSA
ncbi:MAG TPA: ATP-dependent RNA helicase HrpA [Spongiibacteraceae bacterium]|nr:ATP-dependent RNA helicase HrpA [Spongiibacteraceae bacterium]